MDLAVTLIKSVMRAFYPTRDVLVMDALILHEALRDDDLAYLMATNPKDLHKICGKLREERFLTVHTRSEYREGNPRPSNRTWYYINYRHTIDAIKWRMYTITKDVQGTTEVAKEKKDYFCSHCKAEWTALEVLDSSGPQGLLCHRCHHVLTFEADRNAGGHEQSTRLNDQFQFINELLPKIDESHIPECDFDKALAMARTVVRDATHQVATTTAVDSGVHRPMAVKGLANSGPQSIAINISTDEGASEAEKKAEAAKKEKLAEQNALPSWMSKSTVTGESFVGAASAGPLPAKNETKSEDETKKKAVDSTAIAQIDDIFEKIKAEQAAQKLKDQSDNDDGSDEDEADFEDVPATDNNLSSEAPAPGKSLKRELSDDVSKDEPGSDQRDSKRTKIDPEIKKEDGICVEDEDEEDLEFEDV